MKRYVQSTSSSEQSVHSFIIHFMAGFSKYLVGSYNRPYQGHTRSSKLMSTSSFK